MELDASRRVYCKCGSPRKCPSSASGGNNMHIVIFRKLLPALVLSTMASLTCDAATPPAADQPAVWNAHDLIVSFDHLPKAYSCDNLWYKFRDVLRAIGARPDLQILAYQCGPKPGSPGFSPKVHLRFFIPEAVGRAQARWADFNATPRTVQLAPGHPPSIAASDCELLRQIKNGLLAALPNRVLSFNLACGTLAAHSHFGVSIEALTLVEGPGRVAARDVPNADAPSAAKSDPLSAR